MISALRPGTEFVVVHAASAGDTVEEWFRHGRAPETVTYVPLPDYVSFTDWAEDAYVALIDADDGTRYLIEPWQFLRAGDALIADAVEEYTDIRAAQAPLIFQGGNCLIGDDFWLLGTDYFADTVALLQGGRPPVAAARRRRPRRRRARVCSTTTSTPAASCILVGTRQPIPVPGLPRPARGRRVLPRPALGAASAPSSRSSTSTCS